MKGYPSGMRRNLIAIYNRTEAKSGKFGIDTSGITWSKSCDVWASVDWQKGKTALTAGAIDSYGIVLVRMNWTSFVNMRSRIVYDNMFYQVLPETFHADKAENKIQFMAQVIIDNKPVSSHPILDAGLPFVGDL